MIFTPLFLQVRFEFEYLSVSTIRSLEFLCFKNFRSLNKNWHSFSQQRDFLLFHGFLGIFEANSNKTMQLSLQKKKYILTIPTIVIVELFKIFLGKKVAQIVQKTA